MAENKDNPKSRRAPPDKDARGFVRVEFPPGASAKEIAGALAKLKEQHAKTLKAPTAPTTPSAHLRTRSTAAARPITDHLRRLPAMKRHSVMGFTAPKAAIRYLAKSASQ
jgi:hypothetical protein